MKGKNQSAYKAETNTYHQTQPSTQTTSHHRYYFYMLTAPSTSLCSCNYRVPNQNEAKGSNPTQNINCTLWLLNSQSVVATWYRCTDILLVSTHLRSIGVGWFSANTTDTYKRNSSHWVSHSASYSINQNLDGL